MIQITCLIFVAWVVCGPVPAAWAGPPVDTVRLLDRRGGQRTADFAVESFQRLPVDSLNAVIAAAAAQGEPWTHDAVLVALQLRLAAAGPDELDERRVLDIRFQGEGRRGDHGDSAIVTLVEDQFRDDSVRGAWTRMQFVRDPPRRDVHPDPAPWKLVEIRVAWLCQRGHHQKSFSAELCL